MPIFNYQCVCGQEIEGVFSYEKRPRSVACPCGKRAEYRIASPVIQTLATHMMGAAGMRVDGDGSYVDRNIVDPKTKKPMVITSLSQKKRLMKEHGLEFKEQPNDFVKWADKRKKTKPLWFS